MFEVEIRSKCANLNKLKNKIISIGAVHIKTEVLIDKVFGRPKDLDNNTKIIEGRFSARIRKNEKKTLVEFKQIKRNGIGLEFSSPVPEISDGEEFLTSLGYEEAFTVSKVRDTFQITDFELCLDRVDILGDYLEIEHTSDKKNKSILLKECKEMLSSIDPKMKIESKKYGDLMQDLINSTTKNIKTNN